MKPRDTLGQKLAGYGISRRALLKFAAAAATSLALPPGVAPAIAESLSGARRQSLIWLSFQDCTGCLESLTRSDAPGIERLIFDFISLDYQETLMAAAGAAADETLVRAARDNHGKYLLAIDGSVPTAEGGVHSMVGGRTNMDMLAELAEGAAAVLAIGTCAAYGGIPKAAPNPTSAVGIADLVKEKPIVNIPGCPPIPEVLTGVLVNFLTFGRLPDLDDLGRPLAYFGTTIHDQCYRRPYYDQGKFAHSFDDEGARQGWCLFELGCKGPTTRNACASLKWNGGTSFPIQSGHGCLGCSEPDFWDKGSFYTSLSGGEGPPWDAVGGAAAVGLGIGGAAAFAARRSRAAVDRQLAKEWQRDHGATATSKTEEDGP
ncbi:hydrogenase small subunit [Acidimangrovimonas sediminis]|uniref:hydrogenase small subunit n=1 Tax=Acidimangrovimonas sediminis TaxID=2056283 RepID=UPI000C8072AF|nr:hydrogenase small subunit [Acidimangrovimonas sediminis]